MTALLLGAVWYRFFDRMHSASGSGEAAIASTPQQEAALGLEAYKEILTQSQAVASGAEPARIQAIAQRLEAVAPKVEADLAAAHVSAPHTDWSAFDWQFSLLQSDQVDAFCLPGGKLAVDTGLLPVAQDDDALAVVIGHAIAHALLRHGIQRMAQQRLTRLGTIATGIAAGNLDPQRQRIAMGALGVGRQFGVLLPFSRKDESAADRLGLMLTAAACFDPQAAIPLWRRMDQEGNGQHQPEFLAMHPDSAQHILRLQEWMPRALAMRQKDCAQTAAPAP